MAEEATRTSSSSPAEAAAPQSHDALLDRHIEREVDRRDWGRYLESRPYPWMGTIHALCRRAVPASDREGVAASIYEALVFRPGYLWSFRPERNPSLESRFILVVRHKLRTIVRRRRDAVVLERETASVAYPREGSRRLVPLATAEERASVRAFLRYLALLRGDGPRLARLLQLRLDGYRWEEMAARGWTSDRLDADRRELETWMHHYVDQYPYLEDLARRLLTAGARVRYGLLVENRIVPVEVLQLSPTRRRARVELPGGGRTWVRRHDLYRLTE